MLLVRSLVDKGEYCILEDILVGDIAPQHSLSHKHLLRSVDDLERALLGDNQQPVVFAYSKKLLAILYAIAQIAAFCIVAEHKIPLCNCLYIHGLEAVHHSPPLDSNSRFFPGFGEHLLEILDIAEGILHQMFKLVFAVLDVVLNLLDLLVVLVDVEQRDAPDWNLEKSFYIFLGHLPCKLVCKRPEAVEHSPLHLFGSLLGLNLLVDPLLDEDPVQSPCIQIFQKVFLPELLLCPEHIHKMT